MKKNLDFFSLSFLFCLQLDFSLSFSPSPFAREQARPARCIYFKTGLLRVRDSFIFLFGSLNSSFFWLFLQQKQFLVVQILFWGFSYLSCSKKPTPYPAVGGAAAFCPCCCGASGVETGVVVIARGCCAEEGAGGLAAGVDGGGGEVVGDGVD